MKTSKGNVRFRFGRLLSGILSAAMLFSAAAFQIPVSATGEEAGGYEVLYDFVKDYTPGSSDTNISKTDDMIKVFSKGQTTSLTAVLSDEISDKTEGKKVRLHYDFKWESGSSLIRFENKVFETESESNKLRLGFMQKKLNDTTPYLAYGSGQDCDYNYYETNKITNPNGFSADTWYSVDTIYEFDNDKVVYYIDGNKVGETSLNGFSKIKMMMFSIHEWDPEVTSNQQYYGQTNYCYKNMKLDTGMVAEITDTNDSGAVLEFTQPIDNFDESAVTVKCLETGETPTVNVTKVNDMKYNLSYSTGTNIGGDYMLTFSDAFATVNGISEKTIVYSQKPSVSYEYYINDDFEGYEITDEATEGDKWFDVKNPENQVFTNESSSNPSKYRVPNRGWYTVNENNNKLMKINLSQVYDQKSCSIGFSHATAENFKQKTYIEEFDIKNTVNLNEGITGDNEFQYAAYCDKWSMWYPIFSLKNNVLTPFDATLNKGTSITLDNPSATNGMYHVKVEFGFASDKKFRIYADDKLVYEANIFSDLINYPTSKFEFVMIASSISSENLLGTAYALIDNVCAHNGEEKSSGIKSVQYSSDGINYSPAIGKVDSATKYVKIDFTDAMDTSTLSDINLSNGSNTVAATGTASNDNKTYTLELTDNLAINTDYTLNIPMSVKTAGSNSFAREYNGRITTTAGVFKIDLLDIQKNGATVTKSEIAAQDAINAVVNITNTEGREGEAYLCICVYNDDVMTQVNFDKINLKTESTKSVPITVASTANIKVKAFLWNDFATMKPLIQNKTVE